MPKHKLLIIEDDENLRTQMKWALASDYEVFTAGSRAEGLEVLDKEQPSVITLDLGLPPDPGGVTEGFLTLTEILEQDPLNKVIIVTGCEEREYALRGIEQGAYDHFCKPIRVEEFKVVLQRAFHVSQLERENRELQNRLCVDAFEGMLGTSPQMQEVFASIRKVAKTDFPVLVLGESGTGKELVAQAIHHLSTRRNHSFVAINCGAIPENLIESELFGHEKGAFTGAHIQKKGRVEAAQGGTLFLDEIGNLPLPLQVKLLRFLQEQRLVRVGGREEISVDARVIAATNEDLQKAMQEGLFREDLFFRLEVFSINLPPLRERKGDIPLLAKAFLRNYTTANKTRIKGFTSQALRVLEMHNWPGNVRELENRIKRAIVMAEGTKLTPADLELDSPYAKYEGQGLKEAREAMERHLIRQTLTKFQGNISKTAAELGISRPALYELMDKLKIERK